MTRKVILSVLVFCVAVIVISFYAAHVVNVSDRRQALTASGRLLARLADAGVAEAELGDLAAAEGYTLELLGPEEEAPSASGTLVAELPYRGGKVLLRAPGQAMLLSERARPIRWLMLAVAAGSVCFAVWHSRQVLRPVKELTKVSQDITAGRYDMRVRERSSGEFGRLEHHFNAMAKQLQETIDQLSHHSAEMETIVNAMRNGLIAVDEQMHIIRINPAARRMFEVHGDPDGAYVLDATRNAKLESHLAAAMEQGEMYTAELPVRIQRENHMLRLYVTGLVRENQSIGALALIEDITLLKRLENLRVDFVANVTHELKTPLTSIRGFIETLQQGALDDREAALRFLSIMAVEAERLTHLIDDVLSLTALDAGKKREVFEPIPLAAFTAQMTELLQSSAREKNIQVKLEDRSENAPVLAGGDQLKQVLINLIDNAIKYTPDDGHVLLTIDVDGPNVRLRVKDDGIGIEQEHIPRLFERFYRVDKGRSRSMGGTGLGLAIVKHIIQELSGSIEVASEYGVGTEFTVRLPIAN